MRRKRDCYFVKMVDTQSENKIGLIYREVARKRFERLRPDISKHEIGDILIRGDMDEVESYVMVKHGIEMVVRVLREILDEYKMTLPKDFTEVVLYSEDPDFDVEEVKIGVDLLKLTNAEKIEKAFLLVTMLSAEEECDGWPDYCEDILKLIGMELYNDFDEGPDDAA